MKEKKLQAHPYAELFPMFSAVELAAMAQNIAEYGQEHPIITFEEKILDGRNRYAACLIAKVVPRLRPYSGSKPLSYVISHNLENRRHLSVADRAAIAAKIANLSQFKTPKASNEAASKEAGDEGHISQRDAAEKLGVSRASVQRAVAKTAESKKKEPAENPSWSHADLKNNDEMLDAFTSISAVYGNDDARVIRTGGTGFKKADVLFLARLSKPQILSIQDLVMGANWKPKKAFEFMNRMATPDNKIKDLFVWATGTKGAFWTGEFENGLWTVTCKANRAIPRA